MTMTMTLVPDVVEVLILITIILCIVDVVTDK
jgi:hypothetical protein